MNKEEGDENRERVMNEKGEWVRRVAVEVRRKEERKQETRERVREKETGIEREDVEKVISEKKGKITLRREWTRRGEMERRERRKKREKREKRKR